MPQARLVGREGTFCFDPQPQNSLCRRVSVISMTQACKDGDFRAHINSLNLDAGQEVFVSQGLGDGSRGISA